jgi:hydroxymethylpyrimidine pyrophosphatase-like HAD family hydrolase
VSASRFSSALFECAQFKVAMGNPTNNVKQAATIFAPSIEDEGVAWILDNYVLTN